MSNLSGEAIRYTINGGLPNENDNLYTGPITIKNNMVVSARSFSTSPDVYPGFTDYKSYFINEPKSTLPIISVGGGESLITPLKEISTKIRLVRLKYFQKKALY